jgi:RND family efflux transporter MFP subunit
MSGEKFSLEDLRIDRAEAEVQGTRRRWVGRVGVLVVLVLGAGYWVLGARPRAVRTYAVRVVAGGGARAVLNASGYVVARREATVSSKVTGKVLEVLVEEGMKVEAGQVLARLDTANLEASLKLAEAQLAAARSGLEETRVRLDEAEKEWRRVSSLVANRIAAISDLDRAQAEVNSLRARLTRQQDEVTVAQRQVAVWQQELDDTIIRAPFAGIATAKNAQPGEMISPVSAGGGFTRTGIGTIVDMHSLEIEVEVNESYINRVRPGQAVEAALDAYPDWKIPCQVIAIIPTADRQKSTVKVRVGFNQLDPRMLPQMGVKVAFLGDDGATQAATAVQVPSTAIRRHEGRPVVFLVRDGRVEQRPVEVGTATGTEVSVLQGLSGGEQLIVEGPADLAPGARVRATPR